MSLCDCCRIYELLNSINSVATNSGSLLQNIEFFCVISQQFDLSAISLRFKSRDTKTRLSQKNLVDTKKQDCGSTVNLM